MNGDDLIVKLNRRLGDFIHHHVNVERIIHTVVNVQSQQVNAVRARRRRGRVNQRDRDDF